MVAMDTEKSAEVWDRLSNESGRAYEAFKVFMYMSPAERTVTAAWRSWSGNTKAARPSPFFKEWAREYAWPERARAYDAHIEHIRRRGIEAAIEKEAEWQARQVEQVRNRYNELLARTYLEAIEYMESGDFVQNMRPSDVINVMKVYFEATRHFGESLQQRENEMPDWTPDEQQELDNLLSEIEASDKESEERAEDGEEDSKQAEDEQD
jgi:hypothetical protein